MFVAVQFYSYLGQYLSESPTVDSITETIFKLEEDLSGAQNYLAERDVVVRFDEPIDAADFLIEEGLTARSSVAPLSAWNTAHIQSIVEKSTG